MKTQAQSKPIFTMKDAEGKEQRYTVDSSGQLIPLVEVPEKQKPEWQAVNTILETCKILKLGRNTLMGLIFAGDLKAIKAGAKRWIVPGWAIEEFIRLPRQGA